MIGAPRRAASEKRDWTADRRPFESPAGLRLLIPGWPQFSWGQRERGCVLLGSFVVALAAGILAWGTWLSWCFFAFGFLAHISTTTDAIRQGSFPVFPRRTAVPMIAGSLGVLLYLPILLALVATAWPGTAPDRSRSVYLVNCWAYRGHKPECGHWVWLHLPPGGGLHTARVVAVAGQEVEWTGNRWHVNGRDRAPRPAPLLRLAADLALQASRPTRSSVEPEEEDGASAAGRIARPRLAGSDRWPGVGPYYPVWDRGIMTRLLPEPTANIPPVRPPAGHPRPQANPGPTDPPPRRPGTGRGTKASDGIATAGLFRHNGKNTRAARECPIHGFHRFGRRHRH